ncbi:MAG: hypothetical protein ABEJ82_01855 [Haloplanus sp.]
MPVDDTAGRRRIALGAAIILVGFAAIMSLTAVPATSVTPIVLALGGVALLVAGTLVIGTSTSERTA